MLTACPNATGRRICLCPTPGSDARQYLAMLYNSWLSREQRQDNERIAADPNTTDDQILERIRTCERLANDAHDFWETYQ